MINKEYYNSTSTSKINIKYSANPNWYKQVDIIGDELVAIYNQKFRKIQMTKKNISQLQSA